MYKRQVQDHVNPALLFAGTEFGVFFTVDGGERWVKLTGNAPTISFRDLAIQRRENDLVGATFGRGFWILDDYTPLRDVSDEALAKEALLFTPRKALWYIERQNMASRRQKKASQGSGYYAADNPPYGAVLTYYLKDSVTTRTQRRRAAEAERVQAGEDTPFAGWDALDAEKREPGPAIVLTVRDASNKVVRRLYGPTTSGIHRVAWDLRRPAVEAIGLTSSYKYARPQEPEGVLVGPGTYTVTLSRRQDGETEDLAGPVPFEVVPLREGGALPGADPAVVAAFWARTASLSRSMTAASQAMKEAHERLRRLETALDRSASAPAGLDDQLDDLRRTLDGLREALYGNATRGELEKAQTPTVQGRLGFAAGGTSSSTYGPTPAHEENLRLAEEGFSKVRADLNRFLTEELPAFEANLRAAGAPWSMGQPIP